MKRVLSVTPFVALVVALSCSHLGGPEATLDSLNLAGLSRIPGPFSSVVTLTGRVTTSGGNPVSGATVEAVATGTPEGPGAPGTTTALDGAWELDLPLAGTSHQLTVRVRNSGVIVARFNLRVSVLPAAGAEQVDVTIESSEGNAQLECSAHVKTELHVLHTPSSMAEGSGHNLAVRFARPIPSTRNVTITSTHPSITVNAGTSATLVFQPGDAGVAQTVLLTALHDDDATSPTVDITIAAHGAKTITRTITAQDADVQQIVHTPFSQLTEGVPVQVDVRLAFRPDAPFTVQVSSSNTRVTTSPTSLLFTPANYAQNQTMTVHPVSDVGVTDETATVRLETDTPSLDRSIAVRVDDDETPPAPVVLTDVNFAVDPQLLLHNGKIYIVAMHYTTYHPQLFICSTDGTGCTNRNLGEGLSDGRLFNPVLLIDSQNGKLILVGHGPPGGSMKMLRCALDGTGCVVSYPFSGSFLVLDAAIDPVNQRIVIVGQNGTVLIRCNLDGTGCASTPLAVAIGDLPPRVLIDGANQKLVVAGFVNALPGERFRGQRCNLDGSACSSSNLDPHTVGAHPYFSVAMDSMQQRVLFGFQESVLACSADLTSCSEVSTRFDGGYPFVGGAASLLMRPGVGDIVSFGTGAWGGYTPRYTRCLSDLTECRTYEYPYGLWGSFGKIVADPAGQRYVAVMSDSYKRLVVLPMPFTFAD